MANQHDDGGQTRHVFVSYSHDDEDHKALVREFCTILRRDAGLDVHFDQWADDGRRDWAAWAQHQIREADFILAVASPAFRRRADGLAASDEGRGAQYEAALLRDLLTKDLVEYTRRILPVVLPGRSVDEIPEFLRPYSTTHYLVGELTLAGMSDLLDALRNVAQHPKPERGVFVGNPLARLHADLQTEEYTRPHGTNNVAVAGNGVNNGVIYHGNSRHDGDVVYGTKIVHKGQDR